MIMVIFISDFLIMTTKQSMVLIFTIQKPKVEKSILKFITDFGEKNQKDHHGVYVWKSEKAGNKDFSNCDFDAYVGDVELDSYKKGCYLSKSGDNFYVYYGKFEEDGKKK